MVGTDVVGVMVVKSWDAHTVPPKGSLFVGLWCRHVVAMTCCCFQYCGVIVGGGACQVFRRTVKVAVCCVKVCMRGVEA